MSSNIQGGDELLITGPADLTAFKGGRTQPGEPLTKGDHHSSRRTEVQRASNLALSLLEITVLGFVY